jgi:hypothetical protein
MCGEQGRSTTKESSATYFETKMGGGVGETYERDMREKPDEERDQSPSNTRILACASSGSQSTCEAKYLVPNQSRACTDEQRQG